MKRNKIPMAEICHPSPDFAETSRYGSVHICIMNNANISNSNLVVFLFGTIFNFMASMGGWNYVETAINAIIGGAAWLIFKLIGDHLAEKKAERQRQMNLSKRRASKALVSDRGPIPSLKVTKSTRRKIGDK